MEISKSELHCGKLPTECVPIHWGVSGEIHRKLRQPQAGTGANTDAFVEHVRRLLSWELSREPTGSAPVAARVAAAPTAPKPALAA